MVSSIPALQHCRKLWADVLSLNEEVTSRRQAVMPNIKRSLWIITVGRPGYLLGNRPRGPPFQNRAKSQRRN